MRTGYRPTRRLGLDLLLFALLAGTAALHASPSPSPTSDPPTLAERRQAVERDLQQARARLAQLPPETPAAGRDRASLEVANLERLAGVLDQLTLADTEGRDLAARLEAAEEALRSFRQTGPTTAPPFSFLAVEALRDQLDEARSKQERTGRALRAARNALSQAKGLLEDADRNRRRRREEATGPSSPSERGDRERALALAQLELRLHQAVVDLRARELSLLETRSQLLEQSRSLLEEQIAAQAARLDFSKDELVQVHAQIDGALAEARGLSDEADRLIARRESQWLEARRHLASDPAGKDEIEARRLALEVARVQAATGARARELLEGRRELWDRRHAIATGKVKASDAQTWTDEAKAARSQVGVDLDLRREDMAALSDQLLGLRTQLAKVPDSGWLQAQTQSVEELLQLYGTEVNRLEQQRHVLDRLLAELGDQASGPGLLRVVLTRARAVWSYEIYSVDDQPITVAKIILGFALLIIGLLTSRKLSALLARHVLSRLRIAESAVAALETVLFYVLVVTFALLALKAVSVPLTAFTLLGGALAIGFGFGSQNIINNFISGLILLAERQIRLGDLIRVADLYGLVEHIGPRSTRVRTGDNLEIIVPNSSFLEQNVINLTLTETRIRTSVTVGVAYGSPVRDVKELLLRSVSEHGRILPNPPPTVLFTDFGDNALNFEVHFWIQMRSIMDRRKVESDVRFRIDALFREADVVIAFPQRDVHLDTLRPIEVRMVEREPREPPGGAER